MRVGALCAGYGGLEAGLASVTDVDLAWYAEYDAAPSAIMAHHHPGVANLHDVTTIDWAALDPVDVLTAGYPCQPFSAAGMRRGEDDPRHLWPHIAKGIAILRPPLCVFENVRGHLSLGFDKVLHDLHRLGYDVRWYLLRAADVGAAHGRARLFIFATDRSTVPAADLPTGAPVAVASGDGWLAPESGLFGADPFAGKLPPCGRMVEGHLYAEPKWLAREDARLLPTPTARDWKDNRIRREPHRPDDVDTLSRALTVTLLPTPKASNNENRSSEWANGPNLGEALALLPTPAVNDMGEGKDVDAWDAWTERMKSAHGNGNGHGKSLAIEAQRMLLPTPRATRGGSHTETRDALLPTPLVGSTSPASHGQIGGQYRAAMADALTRWGDYSQAIARWETVIGRPAPSPTEPGAKGGHRLAPRFVEWLMGLPEGWVCDVPGLTRNNQLKALGNGVVPHQCAAAYRAFLADEMRAAA